MMRAYGAGARTTPVVGISRKISLDTIGFSCYSIHMIKTYELDEVIINNRNFRIVADYDFGTPDRFAVEIKEIEEWDENGETIAAFSVTPEIEREMINLVRAEVESDEYAPTDDEIKTDAMERQYPEEI